VRLELRSLAAPLLGALVLALTLQLTLGALHTSGAWHRPTLVTSRPASPYTRLDQLLSRTPVPVPAANARDPFTYGGATVVRPPAPGRRPPAPVASRPVLTAIVWDADPWATLRWGGREYNVRTGALFADFRVVSISRDEVVLDRDGASVVLRLPPKGE
jgi:hypothetical protein